MIGDARTAPKATGEENHATLREGERQMIQCRFMLLIGLPRKKNRDHPGTSMITANALH
jgi:hypothetical protein